MNNIISIKLVKKIIISVIGFTVLLIGLVMIVLPGPAIIVIPAGLAILSIEFIWAKKLLKKVKEKSSKIQTDFLNYMKR